jgi:hypothetical protein
MRGGPPCSQGLGVMVQLPCVILWGTTRLTTYGRRFKKKDLYNQFRHNGAVFLLAYRLSNQMSLKI